MKVFKITIAVSRYSNTVLLIAADTSEEAKKAAVKSEDGHAFDKGSHMSTGIELMPDLSYSGIEPTIILRYKYRNDD